MFKNTYLDSTSQYNFYSYANKENFDPNYYSKAFYLQNHQKSQTQIRPLQEITTRQNYENSYLEETRNVGSLSSERKEKKKSDKCEHQVISNFKKSYCRECGIFIPKSGAETFRESSFKAKLDTNPDQVYNLMLEKEDQNRQFIATAYHIKYRKALVDWICEVAESLKLTNETVHLTISYMDTFLANFEVPKNKVQLVCITCLMIASKFQETDSKTPELKEFHEFCKRDFSLDLLKTCELMLMEKLDWVLKTITPFQFTQLYLSKGCTFSSDKSIFREIDARLLKYLRKYAEFFVDLSLQDYDFVKYNSHMVACASIAGARRVIGLTPTWTEELEELTQSSWSDILPCFDSLYNFFEENFPDIAARAPQKKNEESEEKLVYQIENEKVSTMPVETPFKQGEPKKSLEKEFSSVKQDLPNKTEKPMIIKPLWGKSPVEMNKLEQCKVKDDSMNIETFETEEPQNSSYDMNYNKVKRNLTFQGTEFIQAFSK